MSSFTHATTLLHAHIKTKQKTTTLAAATTTNNQAPFYAEQKDNNSTNSSSRRKVMSTFVATSMGVVLGGTTTMTPQAAAQNWGTRSFLREHFFEAGLSPEDAVARIKQTAEGLHDMREMLETMSWRYVMFYIRLKQAYLDQDLKTAMSTLPDNRRNDYIKIANELVDHMTDFDRYVRTPKVYESYLYYEKTLKSIDQLVAILA
ncbi:hypothetical protein HN51_069763 [Arachis hypogaea]|uniref:Uncharacterized protein n=1 Tax=Arachis hypogaea TaxID=3818 RepID=A0A444Z4V8_ARAHY|nr:photosynthetic NDH subunit of lumenal location 2, chloroplastic [Arachis ipaensis]XP_025654754.1 photosynthetic NDH subunit of lumenal location 2, chloroplastic [Arachis hypogaea]QHO11943.1 Photosynthetic NDH subunit of lumenal location 2 [Arachis hypogaea]RYR09126.1 hypothetical protein Ahy_B05g077231 [Arachis hypogaea]